MQFDQKRLFSRRGKGRTDEILHWHNMPFSKYIWTIADLRVYATSLVAVCDQRRPLPLWREATFLIGKANVGCYHASMIDQGFTMALPPAQLAAVLSGGTLDGQGSNWVRAWGGLKLLFGGLEALGAGALILTPEPTMLTKGAGVALGAHGIDTFQSGSRQVWSGVETRTATSESTAALAKALGVDAATAQRIGDDIDMAVPVALTLGIGAARIAAVRGGRIVLAEHEATALRAGGHTIARHVGRTDAELAERLAKSRLKTVSTFSTLKEAEMAVSQVARANRVAIQTWARTASVGDTEAFVSAFGGNGVGRVMLRGATSTVAGRTVKIVLKKQALNGKLYYILTAFPGV